MIECFLRVNHTAHDPIVAHDNAASRVVLVYSAMNQDTLEVGDVAHPRHDTIVFPGVRVFLEVRELRRLDKGDFESAKRNASLRLHFLLTVVELAVVVDVSVFVLDGVANINTLAVGHVIEVSDGVQAF